MIKSYKSAKVQQNVILLFSIIVLIAVIVLGEMNII